MGLVSVRLLPDGRLVRERDGVVETLVPRVDRVRLEATTEAEIAAQEGEDEAEARDAAAAYARYHGWSAKSVIGHSEWSDWKSDPHGPKTGPSVAMPDAQVQATITVALNSLKEIVKQLEDLVVVELLDRLGRVIDNLGGSFDQELDRVANAFDAMLAAIPLDSGRSASTGLALS